MANVAEIPGQVALLQVEVAQQKLAMIKRIIGEILRHRDAWPFKAPVDVKALNIPDYLHIIKHPMDFGTIKKRMDKGHYNRDVGLFFHDLYLVFDNAYLYNTPGTEVCLLAESVQQYAVQKIQECGIFSDDEIEIVKNTNQHKYDNEQDLFSDKIGEDQMQGTLGQHPLIPDLDLILKRFDGDDIPMSTEEKEQLFQRIHQLPESCTEMVIKFIQMCAPQMAKDVGGDVLEFDLDDMDVRIQRHLESYVNLCLKQIQAPLLSQESKQMVKDTQL